jgi:hypothetical protein
MKKGRYRNGKENQTHCKRGHLLSGENVRITGKGRECKECDANRAKAKWAAMGEDKKKSALEKMKQRAKNSSQTNKRQITREEMDLANTRKRQRWANRTNEQIEIDTKRAKEYYLMRITTPGDRRL